MNALKLKSPTLGYSVVVSKRVIVGKEKHDY